MEGLRLVPLSAYHIDCRILEVEPGASLEEIKQAYRDQIKVWHPDRFVNDVRLQKKAEEKIKQISLAYRRLCGVSPYEQQVPRPAVPRPKSDWGIAVFALGRALKNSAIVISRPIRWLIFTATNISNCVFQWCCRERKSLAIATSAFVLGFGSAVWLLPRTSDTWIKITGQLQRAIEKNGTAQSGIAQASAAVPTVPPQAASIATSSPETAASLPSWFPSTSSDVTTAVASTDIFSSEKENETKAFELGEEPLSVQMSAPFENAGEHWLTSFGAMDYPHLTARDNYIPISFVPHQNALYFLMPSNDVEGAQLRQEQPNVAPQSDQLHAELSRVVARQQAEENMITKHPHPAALETSHPGTRSDENVVLPEKALADRKKPASQVTIKPLQARRTPNGSIIEASAAKVVTTYAPRPDYPEEARSRRIAGRGVCVVSIDPFSGNVTNASMAVGTGSPILDKSVLRTLRTWKFKPGTVSQVSVPVEFATEAENP